MPARAGHSDRCRDGRSARRLLRPDRSLNHSFGFMVRGVPMLTGLAALENTDWSRLHHAYGRATDTPGHLRALLREDLESRKQAMSHLWSAIIHQGTPWTATGPTALVVAGLLSDGRIDRGEPIRANLLAF